MNAKKSLSSLAECIKTETLMYNNAKISLRESRPYEAASTACNVGGGNSLAPATNGVFTDRPTANPSRYDDQLFLFSFCTHRLIRLATLNCPLKAMYGN